MAVSFSVDCPISPEWPTAVTSRVTGLQLEAAAAAVAARSSLRDGDATDD